MTRVRIMSTSGHSTHDQIEGSRAAPEDGWAGPRGQSEPHGEGRSAVSRSWAETMIAQIRGLQVFDLQAIDLRRGLTGLVVILAAIPVLILFGTAGVIAGLAALFVIMTDG